MSQQRKRRARRIGGRLPEGILIFRIDEVRKLLRLSRRGAYRLGQLIGHKLGRRMFVSRERLEAWLRSGAQS